MKICFVTRGVPSERYPILGIFEWDQAKNLSKLGHEIIYLSIDLRSIRRRRKLGYNSYVRDGINVEEISLPLGNIHRCMRLRFGRTALNFLLKKVENKYGKIDVIHSHFTDLADIAADAAVDIPHVITEHSSQINTDLKEPEIKRIRNIYGKATQVISVSKSLQERIHTLFNIDSLCIHNIVDTDIFDYENRRDFGSKPFTYITVGNLTYNKHIDLVVEAFNKVVSNGVNAQLVVIGDGPERSNINKIIKDKNLENRVKMLGRLNRFEISGYMKEANCFVLASRSETFGVVYIEALASGLPVIATKCGGPEDFVNEINGELIPVDDIDSLVQSMMRMSENCRFYNNEVISRSIKEQFSGITIAKKIENVYKTIIC